MEHCEENGMSPTNTEDIRIDLLQSPHKKPIKEPPERIFWTRKSEYLLSLIGYTIGLSSMWRFPYLCMKNGGGAFLIPFTIFMILCGFPLYYLELALGQFSGKSPMVVWNICPLFKGIGFTMVTLSLIVTWYYGTVIAWVLYYLGYTFSSTLPWSTCDNEWNTAQCVVVRHSQPLAQNISSYSNDSNTTSMYEGRLSSPSNITTVTTAASEFWRYKVLNMSNGIENWGSLQWPLVLVLFLSTAMCFLCIIKGVRSVGKVVWVTALMPYVLLTVILVRSVTLEGAVDGIIFYVKPDFQRLLHFQVWCDAALQVFYSLGPAWGGVLTMASFSRFQNRCFSDAVLCVSMDLITAFYCGFVVFSIVGFLAHESGMRVDEVIETGPGLVFLTYPEALTRLPLPQLWCFLFFLTVCFVGVDSQFGMLETVVSGIADMFPHTLGKRKILIVGCAFLFYLLSSLVYATQAGVYIFMFIDWYASAYCIFLTSFLECVVIGWCYGAERFSRDIEVMTGMPVHVVIRWSWCIFVPVAMSIALGMAITNMTNPVYEGYIYPDYIGLFGNIVGLLPIIPIPVVMAIEILKARGPLTQRIKLLLRPNADWLPNDEQARESYTIYKYSNAIGRNIRIDLLALLILILAVTTNTILATDSSDGCDSGKYALIVYQNFFRLFANPQENAKQLAKKTKQSITDDDEMPDKIQDIQFQSQEALDGLHQLLHRYDVYFPQQKAIHQPEQV
ncbi:sodium- and chloride-dependent betaine transporter-like [Ylistrum balloti]|uniref:sodium- and chloride-dependent betaine transporter-like n=1 Tax=Ylistrum balloti TaxID=509963 RepID=UPI002905EAB1|nr:sodium- and chloride-dependent betaine transporter-like [Ylistrum balloti]